MFKKLKEFFLYDSSEEEMEEEVSEIKISELKPLVKPIIKPIVKPAIEPVIAEVVEIKETKSNLDKKTTMYEYTDKFVDNKTKVKIVEESKVVEFKPSIFISPVHGASLNDVDRMREKKQEVIMKSTLSKSKTSKSLDDIYKKVKGLKEEEEVIEVEDDRDQKSLFDYLEEDLKK